MEKFCIKICFSRKFQVKLNLLENFAFINLAKKDKGCSLQKLILKRASNFETLGTFIKNKKMYIKLKHCIDVLKTKY